MAHHMPDYLQMPTILAVSPEVPYGGLAAHRELEEEKLSWADFIVMTQDIGVSLTEFFGSLPEAA
jgi:hypothetical protein